MNNAIGVSILIVVFIIECVIIGYVPYLSDIAKTLNRIEKYFEKEGNDNE